jgi:hypothetical protein
VNSKAKQSKRRTSHTHRVVSDKTTTMRKMMKVMVMVEVTGRAHRRDRTSGRRTRNERRMRLSREKTAEGKRVTLLWTKLDAGGE